MSKPALTLGFGLLLAASGFALLHTAEQRARNWSMPPLLSQGLCPDLALQAAPGRLVTQVQRGASAVLNCQP